MTDPLGRSSNRLNGSALIRASGTGLPSGRRTRPLMTGTDGLAESRGPETVEGAGAGSVRMDEVDGADDAGREVRAVPDWDVALGSTVSTALARSRPQPLSTGRKSIERAGRTRRRTFMRDLFLDQRM